MNRRLLIATALLFAAVAVAPSTAPPEADETVRGVALGLFASEPNYDYGDLLGEIRSRGATDVSIVVQWTMDDVWSSAVENDPNQTAPHHIVATTIRQANDLGMRVTLMPIIRLRERTPQQWRGTIAPEPTSWFASYSSRLNALAETADEAGAERLVIGSELSSMQRHTSEWRRVIEGARARFDGRLSYSANWDAHESVGFWDALDDVGVTAYWPLSSSATSSSTALAAAWAEPRAELTELRRKVGKPVLLTEVGYPSHIAAASVPWDQTASDEPAPHLQARLFRVFCDEVATTDTIDGYFAWNWFGFGGPNEISFTPRGKPAASELERCLRK